MPLSKLLNFSLFTCGLVGALMLMLAVLAYLRGRHKLGDRAGILIIAAILLGVMLALSVGNF
jgi:hypothetical protein